MDINNRIIEGGILLIDLSEDLDLYSVPALRNFINNKLEKDEFNKVIITIPKGVFVDSSGIGVLFYLNTQLIKKNNFNLRLVIDKHKMSLFKQFSFYDHFNISHILEDAINSFNFPPNF